MNQVGQSIVQQLRAQYPKQYQQLEQMKRTNTPEMLLRSTLGKQTPEQRQKIYDFARRLGYSDDQINQIEKVLSS